MLSLLLCGLLLAVLALLAVQAERVGYRNLLLALPDGPAASGQSVKKLEELAETKFPLTYALPEAKTVTALRASHSVTAIGTNDSYASLMGYSLLDGGFFTAAAVRDKERFAVLGETAAARLFGTTGATGNIFEMDGATWLVVGVVRDVPKRAEENADDLTLYIPASCMDGAPSALLAQMDDFGEAAVRSGLKELGIHDSSHKLISLDRVGGAMWGRFGLAWRVALCGAIAVFLDRGAFLFRARLGEYRAGLQGVYLSQLLAASKRETAALAGLCGLLVAGVVAILGLALDILRISMVWKDGLQGFAALGDQWFGEKILALQLLQQWSTILFVVFLAALALALLALTHRSGRERLQ